MKLILIYSGGLDSTVLLTQLLRDKNEVRCLGINYGQRHARELQSAEAITDRLNVAFRVADLSALKPLLRGSSQTDSAVPVPHGHYTAESMKLTVVPNRNMLMLSCGVAWAISTGSEAVAYGAHAGDHAIYPDCRDEFAQAMDAAAMLCDWKPVHILRPFVKMTKAQIVTLGASLQAPMSATWSCYEGGAMHCGRCGTCVERKEAFALANVSDPTAYVHA